MLLFFMPKKVFRAVLIPGLAMLLVFSAAALTPARDLIGDRFSSFIRLQEDQSAGDRVSGALRATQLLIDQPEGFGLGVPQDLIASDGSFSLNDNGLANGFLALGLLPGILYFGCLAILLVQACRSLRHKPPEVRVVAVAAVAIAAQLPLSTAYLGPTGVLLWMFSTLGSSEEYSLSYQEDFVDAAPPMVSAQSPRISAATGRGLLN
jgi:hypothetical protein